MMSVIRGVPSPRMDKDRKMEQNKYRDAIEQVHTFNSKLLLDRRLRMPYIDSQTGIAHQDCHLWVSRVQRCPPLRDGQVYSYPARRWRCLKRPDFTGINKPPQKPKAKEANDKEEDGADGSNTALELAPDGGMPSESVEATMAPSGPEAAGENDTGSLADSTTPSTFASAAVSSTKAYEMSAYDDLYQNDDFESDYDSGEEFGTRRKKRKTTKPKSKKNALAMKLAAGVRPLTKEEMNAMTPEDRKKPYDCKICCKRYKNMQGLRYHYEHYNHDTGEETGTTLPVEPASEVPEDQPSVDHVAGAKRKKGSPPSSYCDFCLGDTETNKKSGSSEQLISCSDCGRSGHPSCLQFTDTLIEEVKKYRWQCIECKCCCLCGTSDNDDKLLFCDECDRGYHMYCLQPPIDEPPEGSWQCQLCTARINGEDITKVSVLPQHMNIDIAASASVSDVTMSDNDSQSTMDSTSTLLPTTSG